MSGPSKPGTTDGCWTCKLRRKKCDERRPACEICTRLSIACAYGPKPTWMGSARQQREMSDRIKSDIKRKAAHRRGVSGKAGHEAVLHDFNIIPDIASNHQSSPGSMKDSVASTDPILTPESNPSVSNAPPLPWIPGGHQRHRCLTGVEQFPAIETDFLMKYLDFIFPALFPFYRPGFFETGRSWLVQLLSKSKIAYHSTISLSCYFFTMVLTDANAGPGYRDCKYLRWGEVEQQIDKCFESIRKDMAALDLKSSGAPSQKVEVMGGVVQVLVFEMALGKCSPCNPHLTAAFSLFEDLMASSSQSRQDHDQSILTSVLLNIGEPSWTMPDDGRHIWSPEQAGFRFFSGLLLFADVVASTVLRQPPKLLRHHPDILSPVDDGTPVVSDAAVHLSNTIGCRNWVMRAIAEISALAAWKQQQSEANSLSIVELVNRSSPIADVLTNGIAGLESSVPSSPHQYTPFNLHSPASTSSISTLIWAHAAQLYLSIVVSGWQLSSAIIRHTVSRVLEILQTVPIYQLRALAWPICVAGCLALGSEQEAFLALFANQGRISTAGALDVTKQTWEEVWVRREGLRGEEWDLAECFAVLGAPVLLV